MYVTFALYYLTIGITVLTSSFQVVKGSDGTAKIGRLHVINVRS